MCVFCNLNKEELIFENDTCYTKYSKYPVSPGHILIIPKRHFENFFNITNQEYLNMMDLLDKTRFYLICKYNPDGFNIGVNVGEAAGQTIMHLHVHLIPRYKGDMDNPRGGVRGVIPDKRIYNEENINDSKI